MALIRRFFTEQLDLHQHRQALHRGRRFLRASCTHDLSARAATASSGARALASSWPRRILRKSPTTTSCSARSAASQDLVHHLRRALLGFMHYNNLEEVVEQKYKEIDQVRQEYPHIVQLFKNSTLPARDRQGPLGGPRRLRRPSADRAQLQPARGSHRRGLLRQVQEPLPGQPGDQAGAARRRCWTPSPRSTPRSSGPTRSSTAPSAACSTSTRRWGS